GSARASGATRDRLVASAARRAPIAAAAGAADRIARATGAAGSSGTAGFSAPAVASLAALLVLGGNHEEIARTREGDLLAVVDEAGGAGRAHAEGPGVAGDEDPFLCVVHFQGAGLVVLDLQPR